MADEEPRPKSTGLSIRGAVLAGVGIVGILALALYVGTVLLPFLQTRAILRKAHESRGPYDPNPYGGMIERLGGSDRAAERFVAYLRWPDWAAPDKDGAIRGVINCGDAAARPLLRMLGDPNPAMRRHAAHALGGSLLKCSSGPNDVRTAGRYGVNLAVAVPALKRALRDEDAGVRKAAARSLMRIAEARAAAESYIGLEEVPPDE